jgi:NAD(P)-dependent dehydrogenase (short-subunit alcohol dehydrogenase family)
MGLLESKVAIVTGAGHGIGRGEALELARQGATVVVNDVGGSVHGEGVDKRPAEEVAEIIRSRGGQAAANYDDIADWAGAANLVRQAVEEFGRLDVLVNNAGVGLDFGVAGVEPDFEKIQKTLETNFFGAYRLSVALLPLLRASAHPRIVNVSSGMGGVAEMGGWSPGYRVSKASLNAVTRILSTELADDGFKVNSACPGFVNTDMGGPMGAQKPVEDGAAGIVWLATLPDDGPSGGFFRDGAPVVF